MCASHFRHPPRIDAAVEGLATDATHLDELREQHERTSSLIDLRRSRFRDCTGRELTHVTRHECVDRSVDALRQHATQRSHDARRRIEKALRELRKTHSTINVNTVARVSAAMLGLLAGAILKFLPAVIPLIVTALPLVLAVVGVRSLVSRRRLAPVLLVALFIVLLVVVVCTSSTGTTGARRTGPLPGSGERAADAGADGCTRGLGAVSAVLSPRRGEPAPAVATEVAA